MASKFCVPSFPRSIPNSRLTSRAIFFFGNFDAIPSNFFRNIRHRACSKCGDLPLQNGLTQQQINCCPFGNSEHPTSDAAQTGGVDERDDEEQPDWIRPVSGSSKSKQRPSPSSGSHSSLPGGRDEAQANGGCCSLSAWPPSPFVLVSTAATARTPTTGIEWEESSNGSNNKADKNKGCGQRQWWRELANKEMGQGRR